MSPDHTTPRPVQPAVIRSLHWLTLLMLLAVFGLVLAHEALDAKTWRQLTLDLHRSLGLMVWVLAGLRLVVRSRVPMRPAQPPAPRWQRWAASATHGLMYALLVALPLLGWALSSARGQAVWLPLLGHLPTWPARDLDLADTLEAVHGTAAWLLAGLVASHAAIAIWHHRVRRDGVLQAMLPSLGQAGRRPGRDGSGAARGAVPGTAPGTGRQA